MKRYKKSFFKTLFKVQNKYHYYGVLLHTIAVSKHILKNKEYKMFAAALLHDIGKPYVAFQDDNDKITGEYSFHNHEEISYYIIKDWIFISDYTKKLVRYHYLLRGMSKAKERNQIGKYKRMKRHYDGLSKDFKNDLSTFMKYDDLGKKKSFFI